MQRDWELVRRLLIEVDNAEHTEHMDSAHYHIRLLNQAGFITLTPEGKTFLDGIRSDDQWHNIKAMAAQNQLPLTTDVIEHLVKIVA